MKHSLLFDDDLELIGGGSSDGAYSFMVWRAGIQSFGEPQPVEVAINSLLRDGALTSTESVGNREVSLLVEVQSTDGGGLARGIAALHQATQKRTTLAWTPPDGYAPTTVFDVETSSLHVPSEFDDLAWVENRQTFRLRLVCLPYARSLVKFTDAASSPPSGGSGTVFNNCESTTGWATWGYQNQTPSITVDTSVFTQGAGSVKSRLTEWYPGSVSGTGNGTGGYYSPCQGNGRDQVTGLSLDTGTGGYVSVAVRYDPANDLSKMLNIWQQVSGGAWTAVPAWASVKIDPNGFVHYRWAVAASQTITGLRFESEQKRSRQDDGVPAPFTWYDDFRIMPTASTDQSIVKQLKVEGSAPTTGSLHIASGDQSVGLGATLLVTVPSEAVPAGFNPDGRIWVTNGDLTTDPTALQGSHYAPHASNYLDYGSFPVFDVPVNMLAPGAYTMVALIKPTGYPDVAGVRAQLNVNGTLTGPTSTAEVKVPNTSLPWQFTTLGTVYLPPVPVEGADPGTTVRLTFKGVPMANVYMIPSWIVNGRPVADFSVVDCGTGTASIAGPSSNLWIDSPSARQPQGGWWRGPTADRMNTRSAWIDVKKPGVHTFNPGELSAFLVTGAFAPTLALEYHPNWFGAAAL